MADCLAYNGVRAVTAAALGAVDTTLTLTEPLTHSGAVPVPTVAADHYLPLSLLDTDGNLVEIVHLTDYVSGATTGTISRGREGTTATTHSGGTNIVHAPTVRSAQAGVLLGVVAASTGAQVSRTATAGRFGRELAFTVSTDQAANLEAVIYAMGSGFDVVLALSNDNWATEIVLNPYSTTLPAWVLGCTKARVPDAAWQTTQAVAYVNLTAGIWRASLYSLNAGTLAENGSTLSATAAGPPQ